MPPTPNAAATAPAPAPAYAWNGDGVPGSPKIVVHISEQRAYFFKGKVVVGETTVSTGKPGFSTPPGQYRVVWKNKDHISTRFGDYVDDFGNVVKSNVDSRKDSRPKGSRFDGARMPYAMFFRGGYAMHQGYVPPFAASHGCIRLPNGVAEIFFDNAPLGTQVIVKEGPAMRSVIAPDPNPVPDPSAPVLFRPPGTPAPVRPVYARSTLPTPTPAPAIVRSYAPALARSPSPAPVRSASVRSTVPVPGPPSIRPQASAPLRSPSPVPVRASAPASVRTTPPPVISRPPGPVRSRVPVRSPAPSPTPTPRR